MKIFNLLDTQYNNFIQSVKSYLTKTLSSNNANFGNNTVFGQLITVLANAIQNIMLYIEDSLVEQNKYTAQRKKSIYGLASLTGYNPFYGKAAGTQVRLNYIPNNSAKFNIVINNREPMTCTQNGLQYNLILSQEAIVMSIDKDNSSRFIYAVQGAFETQTFVSTGGKFYTQNFKFLGNMDIDYLEVRINDEVWERVASIYDMTPNGKQYTYKVSNISGAELIFGNECYGKALEANDIIKVTYLVHDGESGNINTDEETYFVFNNDLSDISGNKVDGNSIFSVTFANNDPVISGSNSESIEQVRQMIGLNSRSLVLASEENYKGLINNFSFCGYNKTWSEKGSLMINSIIMKNYKQLLNESKDYFNLKESDFKLSESQKQSIINYIASSGNQFAGSTYNILDPELCKYAMYMYIKLKNTKSDRLFLENKIRNIVGDFFCNIDDDSLIAKSDIIYIIKNNISDIDSLDLYFLSEKNESALISKSYIEKIYEYDPVNNTYIIKEDKISLDNDENPNLGLDNHGNIYISHNDQFPVLMGGWSYPNSNGELITITDPLIITIE